MKPKLYSYKGAWMSAHAIARHAGINPRTLYDRLASGMSIEAATSEPIKKHGETNPTGPKPKLYSFRGKHLPVAQIANILGCCQTVVYKRRCGDRVLDGEELTPSFKGFAINARLVTYKGKTDTLTAWARRHKLSPGTIKARIEKGWPVERALRAPRFGGTDTLTFNGRTHSFGAWSKQVGISPQTLRHRIEQLGWPVERALTEPVREVRTYHHDGKELTIPKWARETGIKAGALRHRVEQHGMTIAEAIGHAPSTKSQRYSHGGKSLTLSEWSKKVGITAATLRERIHQSGWPIERALTTPVKPRGCSKTSTPHLGTGPGKQPRYLLRKETTGA